MRAVLRFIGYVSSRSIVIFEKMPGYHRDIFRFQLFGSTFFRKIIILYSFYSNSSFCLNFQNLFFFTKTPSCKKKHFMEILQLNLRSTSNFPHFADIKKLSFFSRKDLFPDLFQYFFHLVAISFQAQNREIGK